MSGRITGLDVIDRHYDAMVGAMGTDRFGAVIHSVANDLGVHDLFGFMLVDNGLPSPVIATSDSRANFYSTKYHRLDPMLKSLRRTSTAARISFCRVRAADIKNANYRRDCFENAFIDEKMCFTLPGEGKWSVLNFYRVHGDDQPDLEACRIFAEIIMPLMSKHAAIFMHMVHLSSVARIERLFHDRFPILTDREAAVCARTAVGKTAQEISDELAIAKSSVLTYRRRAYERLNVSSASQLLDRFDA